MNEGWIVQRIEKHGAITRTVELPEDEANRLYCNWCDKIKAFNDQSISLIKVVRTEKVVATHVNTGVYRWTNAGSHA